MTLEDTLAAEAPPLQLTKEGVLRVQGTRVPIDTVIGAYEDGETPEEIVHHYSSLNVADVYAVISYYLRHRSLMEAYLEQRRERAAEIRRENEARFPSQGVRERLLARRNGSA
jgi:uncharacterized protein (DUF433 family)